MIEGNHLSMLEATNNGKLLLAAEGMAIDDSNQRKANKDSVTTDNIRVFFVPITQPIYFDLSSSSFIFPSVTKCGKKYIKCIVGYRFIHSVFGRISAF